MIKINRVNHFRGVANEASLDKIKQYISKDINYSIDLVESEKIIKLNIPWGELYRKCTGKEWDDINRHIKDVIG